VCLRPHGDRFQAGFVLDRAPDQLTLFALWRADRDFSDDEVAPVQLLAAALAASLRVRDNLTALGTLAQDGCPPARSLTARQTQVVALVAQGLTNDQIARRLGLSARTVRKHLEVLFARTGARSRTELAVAWRDSVRGRPSTLAV
jgi:DNA-binding NarL/FixJ family response regulator